MERIHLSNFTALLVFLVAAIAFLAGAYANTLIATTPAALPRSVDPKAGRFALVISPLVKNERFLLDTQTGKVWQIAKPAEQSDKPFVAIKPKVTQEKTIVTEVRTEKTPVDTATVEVITRSKVTKTQIPAPKNQLSTKSSSQPNL